MLEKYAWIKLEQNHDDKQNYFVFHLSVSSDL